LTPETLEYLRALPEGPAIIDDQVEICHGSPLDEDLYVVADTDAIRSLDVSRRPVCLFGHTHVAICSRLDGRKQLDTETPKGHPEFAYALEAGSKYLINPGSVGQPRDGDSRAAYAVVDEEKKIVTLHRVAYPIEVAQKKILKAGLPPMLAYRLAMGR
jgi:diadenosine tetraphosphatase ApaH/serine/threonine PP2A family protein phosphatase